MVKGKIINVQGREIALISDKVNDYISLTDMARYRDAERTNYIIQNWMRTRSAIDFCGLWEQLNNPDFKSIEFDAFKNEAGLNSFALTPQKWIDTTNAIKENLIPAALSKEKINFVYADEADMLNMALFGMTAKQWRDANPQAEGNMRDDASIEQLVVLSNMESINAVLIQQGLKQSERLIQLNKIAITQMKSLLLSREIKKIK
jgi:hypothetical protein